MGENATKAVFDATASTYDRDRTKLIPGADQFYGWALRLIPAGTKRILELGAGSGLFTALIRRAFPQARIHLIDFSEPMLARARERLGDDALLSWQTGDYLQAEFPTGLDAVVTALSVHHLDNDDKRALIRRVYAALRPGGVFVNADQVLGPTPSLEERYRQAWLEDVRSLGASAHQIEESLLRQREDRCAQVKDQLIWMWEAGFKDADCWYKNGRFAVLSGSRS